MHVFLRKSPLCRNHFFGWSKTANSSTACETATLKSPPPRGSDAPHVHQRLRKRPPRCTLDCGFKTLESPALRGFVGGLRALATAALYLVLKSNGFPHPKIRLKKFGFSLKPFPQISSKSCRRNSVPNRFSSRFSTSLTNGPRSLSRVKAGTHSPLLKRSHTRAHAAKQGPSLLRAQCGFALPAKFLLVRHAFIYIHFPVLCEPSLSAEGKTPAKLLP